MTFTNAFYLILKALFIRKIFRFLSWILGPLKKQLFLQNEVNFKTYEVTTWLRNNYNAHIVQYLT